MKVPTDSFDDPCACGTDLGDDWINPRGLRIFKGHRHTRILPSVRREYTESAARNLPPDTQLRREGAFSEGKTLRAPHPGRGWSCYERNRLIRSSKSCRSSLLFKDRVDPLTARLNREDHAGRPGVGPRPRPSRLTGFPDRVSDSAAAAIALPNPSFDFRTRPIEPPCAQIEFLAPMTVPLSKRRDLLLQMTPPLPWGNPLSSKKTLTLVQRRGLFLRKTPTPDRRDGLFSAKTAAPDLRNGLLGEKTQPSRKRTDLFL